MTALCTCQRCLGERVKAAKAVGTYDPLNTLDMAASLGWAYACVICGNKRCPHHCDHRFVCTRSNEPGQLGVLATEADPVHSATQAAEAPACLTCGGSRSIVVDMPTVGKADRIACPSCSGVRAAALASLAQADADQVLTEGAGDAVEAVQRVRETAISDEAVEAALSVEDRCDCVYCTDRMRRILQAAAPHLCAAKDAEITRLSREVTKLTEAFAAASQNVGRLETLLTDRDSRIAELEADLATIKTLTRIHISYTDEPTGHRVDLFAPSSKCLELAGARPLALQIGGSTAVENEHFSVLNALSIKFPVIRATEAGDGQSITLTLTPVSESESDTDFFGPGDAATTLGGTNGA